MNTKKIACIVPTYNGKKDTERLLDALEDQDLSFDLFVVDSESVDGTTDLLKKRNVNFVSISSFDFNHGGTRNLMVKLNPDYDFYVFLTQDAYPAKSRAISEIIKPFTDRQVGAVCGRQLPHLNANLFASHARLFNYPEESIVKSKNDIGKLGLKVPFLSNSFSAYRKEALLAVGGFPDDVILSEDMYVGAKMVSVGWKVGYAASAEVYHSHNYSLVEEWKRYFDIGVFHSREPWIRAQFGGAGGEGMRYVASELRFLKKTPHRWPESILRNAGKLVAYKLGQLESYLPKALKQKLSMHRRYWN